MVYQYKENKTLLTNLPDITKNFMMHFLCTQQDTILQLYILRHSFEYIFIYWESCIHVTVVNLNDWNRVTRKLQDNRITHSAHKWFLYKKMKITFFIRAQKERYWIAVVVIHFFFSFFFFCHHFIYLFFLYCIFYFPFFLISLCLSDYLYFFVELGDVLFCV